MSHVQINYSKEPIRLFKSGLLEFFTHIHPAIVVVIWLPIALYFLIRAIVDMGQGRSPLFIPAGFLVGLMLWSCTEYMVHRFVFHFRARTPGQERVFFLFHGVHHAQPQMKTRLVMPPAVSIPIALAFYGLFRLIVGVVLGASAWVAPLFSGLVTGYLAYDMIHYATHHFPMRQGVLKFLKRYHMMHHAKTPDQRFGVSSPLWDWVFRTMPA